MSGLQIWGAIGLALLLVLTVPRIVRDLRDGTFGLRTHTGKVADEHRRADQPAVFWSLYAAQLAVAGFLAYVFVSLVRGS